MADGKATERPEYVVWQCTQGEVSTAGYATTDIKLKDWDVAQVSRYAIAFCNAVLPAELWGSQENKQLVYRSE